jgi:hypothetical protein
MRRMNNMLLCATAAGSMLFCIGGAGAGVIPPLSSAMGRAMPAQIVSVQIVRLLLHRVWSLSLGLQVGRAALCIPLW